jgi:hypothetical protein
MVNYIIDKGSWHTPAGKQIAPLIYKNGKLEIYLVKTAIW